MKFGKLAEIPLCSVTGKRGYSLKTQAKRAARNLMRNGRAKMRAYRCSDCGRWHVGHVSTRQKLMDWLFLSGASR